jgi:carbon-monoxide dehydrogenase medium subunit
MKPVAFDYVRATSLDEAARLLGGGEAQTRIVSGSQSLGPMLNLRLARPGRLVDLGRVPALLGVAQTAHSVIIGAAVTHSAIADHRTPDIGQGVLAAVAEGIAYRAVRNRGTIGGSLAHADPAADWVNALTALGASVLTHRQSGGRAIAVEHFIRGAFDTALEPGEFIQAIEVPRLSPAARWGYYKVCRKPGEFADAIGAVLVDPGRGIRRAVIGATGGRPILLLGDAATLAGGEAALDQALAQLDPVARRVHLVALQRALAQVAA